MMIDHVSIYATRFEVSLPFYEAVLSALGFGKTMELVASWNPDWPTQRMAAFGPPGRSILWLMERKEKGLPGHLALSAKSREAVHAFHAAGLAAGGIDDGPAGLRPHYHKSYYGAFLRDPDGNSVEAVIHTHSPT
jgi:catechol 2,3-dioxygenase-like lactoylglutathione lyase family enzyme